MLKRQQVCFFQQQQKKRKKVVSLPSQSLCVYRLIFSVACSNFIVSVTPICILSLCFSPIHVERFSALNFVRREMRRVLFIQWILNEQAIQFQTLQTFHWLFFQTDPHSKAAHFRSALRNTPLELYGARNGNENMWKIVRWLLILVSECERATHFLGAYINCWYSKLKCMFN